MLDRAGDCVSVNMCHAKITNTGVLEVDIDHRVDGFWYFGKTNAYSLHRELFNIASNSIKNSDEIASWIIDNTESSALRYAYLTILSLANKALVATGILCNSGYAGEARVHTRKIFELWASALFISTDSCRLASLYNLNDRISHLVKLHRYTNPDDPGYLENMPYPAATNEWMEKEFNKLRKECYAAGISTPETLDEFCKKYRHGWAGMGIKSMVDKTVQDSGDPAVKRELSKSYEILYRMDSDYVHSTGSARFQAVTSRNGHKRYHPGPSLDDIKTTLYASISNFIKLGRVVAVELCESHESEPTKKMESLERELLNT